MKQEQVNELDISEAISEFFKAIVKAIINMGSFFYRNALYLILSIIIGLVIGFVIHKVEKPFYRSELIASTNSADTKEIIRIVDDWDWQHDPLLNDSIISNIKSINAAYLLDINGDSLWDVIEDIKIEGDENVDILNQRVEGYFAVVVDVYDINIVKPIENALLKQINEDKNIKRLNSIRMRNLHEMANRIEIEIKDLDSLKRKEYFNDESEKTTSKISFTNLPDNRYYKDIITLLTKQQSIEEEIEIQPNAINIIQNLHKPNSVVLSLKKRLIVFGSIAFLIGFLVVFFIDFKKRI